MIKKKLCNALAVKDGLQGEMSQMLIVTLLVGAELTKCGNSMFTPGNRPLSSVGTAALGRSPVCTWESSGPRSG